MAVFDALVVPTTMKELIETGFLVPFDLIRPGHQLNNDEIAQSPVDAYREHASGRPTVVFALHIKAATEFRDQFLAAGISCGMVTGAMPMSERRAVLNAFKTGQITVLCNVGVLTEGFDHPPTSCVILARSVGSLSLYIQCLGRALRKAPGKKDAVLIDLHGSSFVHGRPDDDRDWVELFEGDGTKHKKKTVIKERFCPVCGIYLEEVTPTCPGCGKQLTQEMFPPSVMNVPLVKYAAKRRESDEKKKAYFDKLVAIAEEKSYSKWQPVMKFKAIYGEPPPKEWLR